ncbi:unnamed protein product, partial [Discosporangium mesarthrocarpum]
MGSMFVFQTLNMGVLTVATGAMAWTTRATSAFTRLQWTLGPQAALFSAALMGAMRVRNGRGWGTPETRAGPSDQGPGTAESKNGLLAQAKGHLVGTLMTFAWAFGGLSLIHLLLLPLGHHAVPAGVDSTW